MESAHNLTNLGTNGKEISWDRKFPENSKTVKLPKCEPFKPKFREFWEENKMERKSSVGKFGCFPFNGGFRKIGNGANGTETSLN